MFHECEEKIESFWHPNLPLRISQPYLDSYMYEKIYKVDNKNKWMDKKGFNSYIKVKNSTGNMISNYVFTTPGINASDF